MYTLLKRAGGVSVLALAAATVSPAYADGTIAGTDVTNTVTVNYRVGGFDQTPKTDNDTFKVDRKINVVVTTTDATEVPVSPGQTQAVTTFTVKNESNESLDFELSISPQPTGDDFDLVTSPAPLIYEESNGTPGWQASDNVITSLSALDPGDPAETVYVVGTIPNDPVTGDIANIILRATAYELGGAPVVATGAATANGKNTVETVFADGDGDGPDVAYDGAHAAQSGYIVSAAGLTVTKTSTLLSDPISRTVSPAPPAGYVPKMIPGAYVQYCLAVTNSSGSATATSVNLVDAVPGQLTIRAGTLDYGPATSGSPCTITSTSGTNASTGSNVDVTFPSVAADEYYAIVFEAEIQ